MSKELTSETITFGKYKGKMIDKVLKDRSYCRWLLKQDWFRTNYEYLHNRVKEYNPLPYFFKPYEGDSKVFLSTYEYFNMRPVEEVALPLTDTEKSCYEYYLQTTMELKAKIAYRILKFEDNPFDIKAPSRWLKKFESKTGLSRTDFKSFMSSYDLLNIPYIVERIKKEGGIEYKGARSFLIAKERSMAQEAYWEKILKEKYGEDLSVQYKYDDCIFDFLNISTNTIFECKLGLKDFNEEQHRRYNIALKKYRIVYIISYDCVIQLENKKIYTTSPDTYSDYQIAIHYLKEPSYLDKLIEKFDVVQVDDLSTLFGTKLKEKYQE